MKNKRTLMEGVFVRLFSVMLVGTMCGILCNVIDAAVTGQFLGSDAVAAVGLTGPVVALIGLVTSLFVAGTGQLCTQSMGKADIGKVNQIFSTMTVCVTAFGLFATVLFLIFSPQLLSFLAGGADPKVLGMAADYLRGYSLIILPMALSSLLNSLLALDNDQKRSMGYALIMLVSDTIMDLLNVFVFHGGMLGMALASSLSAFFGLICLLFHFRQAGHLLRFTPKKLNFRHVPEVLVYGLAGAVPMLMGSVRSGFFNYALIRTGGTDAVAAFSAAGGAFILLTSLVMTIQSSTASLSGLSFGEEDTEGLAQILRISLVFAYRVYLVIGIIVFLFAAPVSSFFIRTDDPALRALAASFVRYMAFQNLPVLASYSLTGSFTGTGHVRLNYLVSFFRDGLYPSLTVLLLGFAFGIPGVKAALIAASLLSLVTCFCIPAVANGSFPKSIRGLLILPKDFGADPSERFEAAAGSMEEVADMSEKAYSFCLERGEDKRTARFVSLFIEEMGGNTIRHGFADAKDGRIELKVIISERKRLIRLKDNGKPFDPVKWLEENDPGDPAANIGIKMIIGLARDVQYIPAMELNNIMVEI